VQGKRKSKIPIVPQSIGKSREDLAVAVFIFAKTCQRIYIFSPYEFLSQLRLS